MVALCTQCSGFPFFDDIELRFKPFEVPSRALNPSAMKRSYIYGMQGPGTFIAVFTLSRHCTEASAAFEILDTLLIFLTLYW